MSFPMPVMTVLMLAIFTVMVAISSTYPPGARFMTFVVGIPAIALCILQLVLDLREERRATAHPRPLPEKAPLPAQAALAAMEAPLTDDPALVRKELTVWAYILALIGSILLFGFYFSVPLFLLTFLRFQARASWQTAIALTATASIFIYVLFAYVFRMTLHEGFVTSYLTDMVSG